MTGFTTLSKTLSRRKAISNGNHGNYISGTIEITRNRRWRWGYCGLVTAVIGARGTTWVSLSSCLIRSPLRALLLFIVCLPSKGYEVLLRSGHIDWIDLITKLRERRRELKGRRPRNDRADFRSYISDANAQRKYEDGKALQEALNEIRAEIACVTSGAVR